MLVKYRHTCVHCATSPIGRPVRQAESDPTALPGCALCADDPTRSPELCGDCAHFTRCDYCRATGVPVVRIVYERAGTRVADTVCSPCTAKHYLLKGVPESQN
jgi:hypothetical protein